MMWRSYRTAALIAAASAVLLGCNVEPEYVRPETHLPASFPSMEPSGTTSRPTLAQVAWFDAFSEPELRDLVRIALENNFDIKIASARVEQLRAQLGIADAQNKPWLDAVIGGGPAKGVYKAVPTLQAPASPNTPETLAVAGVSATWELDFWGRLRSLSDQARAALTAGEFGRRAVTLSLICDVVQVYYELLYIDAQIENSNRALEVYTQTAQIFARRYAGGVAARLAFDRAMGSVATEAARKEDLQRLRTVKEGELSILLGIPRVSFHSTKKLEDVQMPVVSDPGTPEQMLNARPDLLEAEQEVVFANAGIGRARAELYPRIDIGALFGSVAISLAHFFGDDSVMWATPFLMGIPLYHGGALKQGVLAAEAAGVESRLHYCSLALRAFREVTDDLQTIDYLSRSEHYRWNASQQFTQAVRDAIVRYEGGLSTYLEVVEAEAQLFPSFDAYALARLERILSLVRLYKAVGGGEATESAAASQPHSTATAIP